MSLRNTAVSLLPATAALAIFFIFAGVVAGPVLLGYVLFVASMLLAFLIDRLRALLPPAGDFEAVLCRAGYGRRSGDHFEAFKLRLAVASSTQTDLHFQLRLRVRRIASARLSNHHGIDLEREPGRAAEVLRGSRTWELIRPDREPPEDDLACGRSELAQLVEELERL